MFDATSRYLRNLGKGLWRIASEFSMPSFHGVMCDIIWWDSNESSEHAVNVRVLHELKISREPHSEASASSAMQLSKDSFLHEPSKSLEWQSVSPKLSKSMKNFSLPVNRSARSVFVDRFSAFATIIFPYKSSIYYFSLTFLADVVNLLLLYRLLICHSTHLRPRSFARFHFNQIADLAFHLTSAQTLTYDAK